MTAGDNKGQQGEAGGGRGWQETAENGVCGVPFWLL